MLLCGQVETVGLFGHSAIDVVAVAGIAGTLLGALLGALVTWKVQARQLEHEDRTRFHDRRLAVYGEFNAACNMMAAAIQARGSFLEPQAVVIRTFESLRLVASQPVAEAATQVHATMLALATAPVTSHTALVTTFNSQMAALCRAMREEIGVGSKK